MGDVETVFKGNAERLKRRVPAAELVTAERFAKERERIFRRSWLLVAHERELPQPGSYVARTVPTLDASVLVVRGRDGKVRGFHNVCTHRGNKLVPEGSGTAKHLTCGFHGWSFTPDGTLAVITDEGQFRDLDKTLLDLRPIHTEVWYGHVFMNFDKTPRETLRAWLGPMYDQYDGYFEQHGLLNTRTVDIRCNWNLAINAFMEGYHTLYIHAKSVPDYQGGPVNPERHRPFMEMFDRNLRYSAPSNPHHKQTPAETLAWRYGRQCLPAFDGDMTGMPPGINPSRTRNWAFDVVQFHPHTVMIMGNHWHIEMTFWPVDENNTHIRGVNYGYRAKNLGERLSQDFVQGRGRIVVREDLSTLEAQHAALKSGALTHFQLSQQETALQHHYRVAADMLDAA
jgi:Rieske 2Fe-2S family protein